MNYFVDCTSLEELKQLYKKLCLKNHPDLGGDVEVMKAINIQYEEALKRLSFAYNADESNKEPYDWTNDEFAEIIQKIILFSNMKIEIIGQWIMNTMSSLKNWVSGFQNPKRHGFTAEQKRNV